jgi:hypothetical protein
MELPMPLILLLLGARKDHDIQHQFCIICIWLLVTLNGMWTVKYK